MATWAKIRFFYDTMLDSSGSTLTANYTASGDYSVNYLYNMLEINMWKSSSLTQVPYINYDAGTGNTKTADYLAILGHNLSTCNATAFRLQYSSDNTNWYDVSGSPWAIPSGNKAIVKEFTSPGAYRYWRFLIAKGADFTDYPYMTLCIWGNKTELDYATSSFDPYEQEAKANIGISQGGYITGVHTEYLERKMDLKFNDSDSTLYNKIKTWWETSGLKNFFVAWDTANSPSDIFLMRPDEKFNNPFNQTGLYRDISINLKGRKE